MWQQEKDGGQAASFPHIGFPSDAFSGETSSDTVGLSKDPALGTHSGSALIPACSQGVLCCLHDAFAGERLSGELCNLPGLFLCNISISGHGKEVATSPSAVTPETSLLPFSFGIVLWEIATGKIPFAGEEACREEVEGSLGGGWICSRLSPDLVESLGQNSSLSVVYEAERKKH